MLQPRRRNYPVPYKTAGTVAAAAAALPHMYNLGKAMYAYSRGQRTYNSTATSNKSTSSKPASKPRKPVYKRVKSLGKKVKQLTKIAEAEQGVHIHRVRSAFDESCASNGSIFRGNANFECNSQTQLEAVLAELRYYDPSNPGTLVQASGATGTFYKEFYFKRSYHKMTVTNNYQVPVVITLYSYRVRSDTSITPASAFSAGLTDVGNPSTTSLLVYPSDSKQLSDLWRVEKSKTVYLMPGKRTTIICSNKPFLYDPSLYDSHALSYQKIFKSSCFAIRVEGPVGHDTTADEQGQLAAGVDVCIDHTYEILYDAGAGIRFITVDTTGMNGFTNSGVISSMPVSDNIPYSKA